ALDAGPQAAGLRLFRAPVPHRRGRRLRDLSRPDRRDGGRDPDAAAEHELVSGLPSQPDPEPPPGLRGHEHEMGATQRRDGALRIPGAGAPGASTHRLLGVPSMSGTYWRSVGQLEGSDESKQFTEREFPEGASELPTGVTRREMMMLLGASVSLAGLSAC